MAVARTVGIAVKTSDRKPAMIVKAETITGMLMNLSASSIADCGLRIADRGLRTADCGSRIADWSGGSFRIPHSAFRIPYWEMPIWLMTFTMYEQPIVR